MLPLSNIRSIHLELTTACNARCPGCPRNVAGYPHNDGYPECDLTLAQIQTILSTEFLKQINHVYISGNFGDFLMNPQSIEILQYLRDHIRPNSGYICIGTNGGARDKAFWQQVARLSDEVMFCIDGLDDTHSIYRKNTVYRTVINNAQTVIESGGQASWKFIEFGHNRHQIDAARALSKEMGFKNFYLTNHGRSQTPVFDKHGEFEHWIGEPQIEQVPKIAWILQDPQRLEKLSEPHANTVACESLKKQELYITANGDVYPCCFMGHYPHTFQQNMSTWYGVVNNQVSKIVMQNNALEHGLEKAIQWFSNIPDHWAKQNVQQRLMVCDTSCGENNPYQHDQNISNQYST